MTTTTATECRGCGATDPALFGYNPRRCKACVNAAAREYRAQNRDAVIEYQRTYRARDPERHRGWAARKNLARMGMTPERYDEMLAAQGGGCAICGKPENLDGRRLHVDHDHDCCPGKQSCGECVRGLLCFSCNVAIGYPKNDRTLLEAAVNYLTTTSKESR